MKFAVCSTVFSVFALPLAHVAIADTYRSEINGFYSEADADFYSGDNYSLGVNGVYYFAPVDTARGPLAEAAFLQKASSFSVNLVNYDNESPYSNGDSYARSANLNYFIPNSLFFVGVGVQEQKSVYTYDYSAYYNYDTGDVGDGEMASWLVGKRSTGWESRVTAKLGIAPLDGLQIWSDFVERVDVSDNWNLNAKYVKLLVGERAMSVATHYSRDEEYDYSSFSLIGDYYFTPRLSVGVGGVRTFGDDSEGDSHSSLARVRQFVTENASVELTYESADYSSSWRLGGTVRF